MSDNHDLHDERISQLYRTGSRDEPPKQLDDKIIQAARRRNPTSKLRFYWPSLASAAVLVLSISLVLKVLNRAPLEESLLEPASTQDSATPLPPAPAQRLQEGASAPSPAIQDHESGTLSADRFKSAPSGEDKIESDESGLLQPEATPNTSDSGPQPALSKAKRKRLACSDVPLPESASMDVWQQQFQTAIKQGQSKTAECLKQGYYRKFGQVMPGQEQPEGATSP